MRTICNYEIFLCFYERLYTFANLFLYISFLHISITILTVLYIMKACKFKQQTHCKIKHKNFNYLQSKTKLVYNNYG